jgi:hypothetical protein|nr:MAG TPA: hypothetical protein [Bacteriophage sp.]
MSEQDESTVLGIKIPKSFGIIGVFSALCSIVYGSWIGATTMARMESQQAAMASTLEQIKLDLVTKNEFESRVQLLTSVIDRNKEDIRRHEDRISNLENVHRRGDRGE